MENTTPANTTEVVRKEKLYIELSTVLHQVIETYKGLTSKEVAKFIRYAQRCKNEGELGKRGAPNIANVLGLITEKASELYEVSSAELVKVRNKLTGEEKTYIVKNSLTYGNKYNGHSNAHGYVDDEQQKRWLGDIPSTETQDSVQMVGEPQDTASE